MSDLDEIRKRKLEEMQSRYDNDIQEQAQMQEQIGALENAVKQRMTKDALERYGNIKAADMEKAMQVIVLLGQLVQSNKIKIIDDENLKRLLIMISKKKDIKITRK